MSESHSTILQPYSKIESLYLDLPPRIEFMCTTNFRGSLFIDLISIHL